MNLSEKMCTFTPNLRLFLPLVWAKSIFLQIKKYFSQRSMCSKPIICHRNPLFFLKLPIILPKCPKNWFLPFSVGNDFTIKVFLKMSFGGYFGHILSLETIKSTYLLYNLVGIIYAPWVYTKRRQSAHGG